LLLENIVNDSVNSELVQHFVFLVMQQIV